MTELEWFEKPGELEDAIVSIAYGNLLIEDDSPSAYSSSAVWGGLTQGAPVKTFPEILVKFEDSDNLISIGNWSENKTPFTQKVLLDNEEEQVQNLIFQIKRSISIPHRDRIANKLLVLFNEAKEEEPESVGIAVGSLRSFINFLHLYTNLKCPIISLTPNYNIYASWRDEQSRVFSVHFLLNDDVRFVIFKPNDRHPKRKIRVSGIATTDVLMETVISYRIEHWISE